MAATTSEPTTLPAVVLEWAARDADAVAVVEWDAAPGGGRVAISYSTLAHGMLAVAVQLADEHGIRRSQRCALLGHNSPAYLTHSLACMYLGATAIHLNWRTPIEVCSLPLSSVLDPVEAVPRRSPRVRHPSSQTRGRALACARRRSCRSSRRC
eukprot:110145-Prymnesium_polylepis.2